MYSSNYHDLFPFHRVVVVDNALITTYDFYLKDNIWYVFVSIDGTFHTLVSELYKPILMSF